MNMIKTVNKQSVMIEGFSYDRGNFELSAMWTRSLLSGGISTGVVVLGVFCLTQMIDPMFARALGERAVDFKIAAGALLVSLLGYSLMNLFTSVTEDVTTFMRVKRANAWLARGSAARSDEGDEILMKQLRLSMVRYVEAAGYFTVYAVAQHSGYERPILIEAQIRDDDLTVSGHFFADIEEIRSRLNDSCAEWTPLVAKLMGIELDSPDPVSDVQSDFEDDDLDAEVFGVFGRASAPANRAPLFESVAKVPTNTVIN